MKIRMLALLAIGLAGFANAQTVVNFPDATGEVAVGSFPHIDISSVDVTLDAAQENLTFTLNLNGSPIDSDWGKYMIGLRSGSGGTSTGNGWGRPINYTAGMTHWLGCWADGGTGGLEVYKFDSGWNKIRTSYDGVPPLALPVITASSFSVTIPVTAIDYTPGPGQTFTFDVYTSGGGGTDGAVDALSSATASITNWGDTFTTTTPLSFPDAALNPAGDEDGDGYLNGDEINGTSALGYISNPYIWNYTQITVSGDFNEFSPAPTPTNELLQVGTSNLTDQYHWTLDRYFGTPGSSIAYKFTTGAYQPTGTEWGSGGGNSVLTNGGGNIAGAVGPSGVYNFFFNQAALTQTFTRRTFDNAADFLQAYGLSGDPTGDADADGVLNQDEFIANTDPLNSDTDGDGTLDGSDSEPLIQRRDVTFRLDMSVQTAKGFYNPVNSLPKLLVFGGPIANSDPNTGGYVMSEDSPGIYTVTVSDVPGFSGASLEGFGYKFFNSDVNAPNGGYETIDNNPFTNRTLTLGAPGVEQVLGIVFFSNDSTLPGYTGWAAANAGGQTADLDFDLDGVSNGVEFFMGETGSTFTANPGVVANVVSWPKSDTYTGTYGTNYVVQTSSNLSSWADILITDPNLNNGDPLQYTLPAGTGPLFVRLKVIEP